MNEYRLIDPEAPERHLTIGLEGDRVVSIQETRELWCISIKEHRDWRCPYCGIIARNGENKLRHLAKHEPAIRKLLRKNFILEMTQVYRVTGG